MLGLQIGRRSTLDQARLMPLSPSLLDRGLESAELFGVRLRRRLLQTFPLSHFRARDYRNRLAAVPAVSTGQDKVEETILANLRGEGASFSPSQDLIPLLGQGAPDLIESLAQSFKSRFFRERRLLGNEATLSAFPGAWRLGLQPRMLDMAEAYLGLSCFYLGATLRRAGAGRRVGLPQWRLDGEDERVFHVLVYLSSVGAADGPFEFLPRLASQNVEMRAHGGHIADAKMKKLVARTTRRVAYGETGDGVIFDGAHIFHRNRQPLQGERYSITFTYCSRQPLALDPRRRLTRAARDRLFFTLSGRQRECLPPPRRF